MKAWVVAASMPVENGGFAAMRGSQLKPLAPAATVKYTPIHGSVQSILVNGRKRALPQFM